MAPARQCDRKGFCFGSTGLHVHGFVALELLDGEVVWRCAVESHHHHHHHQLTAMFFFSYLCRANLLESKIPFGEEKVLEGVGQLRPHGAEPAGGGVLPGHGQPDGQHLQQG